MINKNAATARVIQTTTRAAVEEYKKKHPIRCRWKKGGVKEDTTNNIGGK